MVTPPYLKPGDTVGIVSTARKISTEELHQGITLLNNWNLKVVLGDTIGMADHQFAGSDLERANDLQKMMDDPNIKAIWCARGGYGTVRIIDRLDFSVFVKHPKWIIGYSDVTVLHSHIHKLNVETLHAQMPLGIEKKSEATRVSIQNVLFEASHEIKALSEDTSKNRHGNAEGLLVGGNLSILYSLCGSPSAIDTGGKILFIEDLDEYLYHVDRMIQNLKRNGMFKDLAGLVVGGMTQMNDNTIPFGKTAEEIIMEAVSAYNYPVCFDFPVGHVPDNRALIMGRRARLEVDQKGILLRFGNL